MSNKKQPKVSIVMPTYNVEKYYRQCLDSVINQTLTDIEIIPVDDGSPDNCGAIMDEYAKKDPRVKPIHKPNGGYGSAVNAGLDAATGEYVAILETDDWVELEMYEKLYKHAKNLDLDVCKCSFYKYDSLKPKNKQDKKWRERNQDINTFPNNRAFNLKEYPEILMFHPSIWASIYKKRFIDGKQIKINNTPGASYQDLPFMAEVMVSAERIGVIHEYLLHWRVEEGQESSTKTVGKKNMIMAFQCEETKKILKKHGVYDTVAEEIYYHFFLPNYGFYINIQNKYKKEYYNKLYKLFKDIKKHKDFEYKYFEEWQRDFLENLLRSKSFSKFNIWCQLNKIIRWFINIEWIDKKKKISVLGISLFKQRINNDGYIVIRIFNIPIYNVNTNDIKNR